MKRLFILICCIAVMAVGVGTRAQEAVRYNSVSSYGFPGLENKISLDIRAMDIVHFLKFLAVEGNLNIVTSNGVTGLVNLLINDVTIGDALEIVLALNNLAYEVKGNIIKIISSEEYKALYGVDFYDQRQTLVYKLKYASPTNVGTMLGSIKSDIGKIIYDDSTGTLVLIDTPDKIKEMDAVIKEQEMPTITRTLPTETRVFELDYGSVDDIKSVITEVLTVDVGTVRSDSRTNSLVVTDLSHKMEEIETIIRAFDRKTRVVFIEAKIVEVTLADTFKWGVDWDRIIYLAGDMARYTINPEVTLPLSLTGSFGKITVDSVSSEHFDLVLEALSTVTETRILSNPHLMVEEGKEAKIEVTEKQPYQEETTTTASGGTTTTSQTYQWVDVGVTLNVTPKINEKGFISMLIKPVVSSISEWYGGDAQEAGAVPVVKSANAETTVTIKDGTTIIIAGLIKDNRTKSVNKIPLLGDIPLLGAAFTSNSDDVRRTETIVFLTPRIVKGDESFLLMKDMAKPTKGVRE